MKTRSPILILILATALLCACASAPDIKGSWIDNRKPQPPINKQGIYFGDNGQAASINAENRAYKSWALKGRELTLRGTDAYDGEIKDFTEVYKVKEFSNETMTLEKDGNQIHFTKDNSANYKQSN